jgi:hypothetical protein
MFPEWCYCTLIVGHTERLPNHLQIRTPSHTLFLQPLLEAPAEGSVWNLPEFGRQLRFGVLKGCEMCPPKAHFQCKEQQKITRSEIRRVRWLGKDRNVFLGGIAAQPACIVVIQKPLRLPRLFRSTSRNLSRTYT